MQPPVALASLCARHGICIVVLSGACGDAVARVWRWRVVSESVPAARDISRDETQAPDAANADGGAVQIARSSPYTSIACGAAR